MLNDFNNKKSYSKKDKILGAAFLIYFILAIILFNYFSHRNTLVCLMIFGSIFIVIGLIAISYETKNKSLFQNLFVMILPLIGIGFIVYAIVKICGIQINSQLSHNLVPILICIVFILTGIWSIVNSLIQFKFLKERCEIIEAECIRYEKRYNTNSSIHKVFLKAPVFSYDYLGKHYENQVLQYTNSNVEEIGSTKNIYINPENPNEIHMSSEILHTKTLIILSIIALIIPGIVGLYFLIFK